jgi:beta-lactamase regulating signal transducer with metallopeptidase domain
MTMPAIDTLLRQPAAQAIGWALLQFVWQGAAVGVLTAIALMALRRSAADVRYVVASIGLALMLTLPAVSGVQKFQALRASEDAAIDAAIAASNLTARAEGRARELGPAPRATRGAPDSGTFDGALRAPGGGLGRLMPSVRRVEPLLPTLILIWIVGVTMLSLRLLTGWIWIQRLRTHGVSAAAIECQRMSTRLARRLHIARAITLLESTLVEVPTVIGWLKPVVLLPASALAALSPQQLEAILAHELAHIRRHDYLVNLLQTLVETLLFYHPAVWWLSRRIRIERENCCDDLAVSLCGDPVAYANALADLESLRSETTPTHHIALAATGGSLLHRVRRLLGAPSPHSGRGPAWLAGSAALLLIGGIALGADGLRQPPATPATPQTSAIRATPVAATTPTVATTAVAETTPTIATTPTTATTPTIATTSTIATTPTVATTPAVATTSVVATTPTVATTPIVATTSAVAGAAVTQVVAVEARTAGAVEPASQSISHHQDNSSGNWIWSNNGEKLQVNYSGTFEFTDDDTDVRQISPGGYLKISDGGWLGRHSVEIRERGGSLERRYFVNLSERPYEPEGRKWLQDNLPKFVRNTGIGAPSRVARFLKSGGATAVMTEISRIDSTYVKGIYFKELFKQATLTPEQYRQAMVQAGREMKSDYELATLLIAVADRLPSDETSRAAYFTAASGISSDYELRRVYSTMLKKGPVSAQTLTGILEHSTTIESDYELSELLRQIVGQQSLDDKNRAAFFRTVSTIESDYERHRVLKAVMERSADGATAEAALAQAGHMGSDYEAATFLMEVLRQSSIEGAARAPFFTVVNNLGSGYERGRVLLAVVKKPDTSNETIREVLRSSKGMSGYELSQLLIAVAGSRTLTGELRDAYLDAADKLSGYEQGQVMTALVKSERRR